MHGGLNIVNLGYHVLARDITMIKSFFQQQQSWAIMLAAMCVNMRTRHILGGGDRQI